MSAFSQADVVFGRVNPVERRSLIPPPATLKGAPLVDSSGGYSPRSSNPQRMQSRTELTRRECITHSSVEMIVDPYAAEWGCTDVCDDVLIEWIKPMRSFEGRLQGIVQK
jgi:hypothetical protein